MNIMLVTSSGACGIAEHSEYLRASVTAADPSCVVLTSQGILDPRTLQQVSQLPLYDLVHLNYHASLHSQWTADVIREVQASGPKVLVTWHDSGVPNSDHCKSIHAVADAFVVHEPCDDLPGAIYWRQGVPDWPRYSPLSSAVLYPRTGSTIQRPYVGTVGFPFPWKNYSLLCEAATIAGWGVCLIAPTITAEQMAELRSFGAPVTIFDGFVDRHTVIEKLGECEATAFCYNCHNSGTSGAIRQGIAARKPVIASRFDEYCTAGRQFRDLVADPLASRVITWINPDVQQLADALSQVRIAPIDAGMVALATQDSWAQLGAKYATLYRELVTR
jgi:hypothetical protein